MGINKMSTRTISTLIYNPKSADKLFGIEIEAEGNNLIRYDDDLPRGWKVVGDGSLRNGYEYILKQPVSFATVLNRLKDLNTAFNNHGTQIYTSDRAAIHVHINVCDLTPTELIRFLCLYYIIEEVFVDTMGENRKGNHFAFRLCDAEYPLYLLTQSVSRSRIGLLNNDDIRYSALNLISLFKFGSLEFRAIQTKSNFSKDIIKVCKLLKHIKYLSKNEFSNLYSILELFSGNGCESMLKLIVGEDLSKEIIENVTGIDNKMIRGMRYSQDIIYSIPDQSKFNWGV